MTPTKPVGRWLYPGVLALLAVVFLVGGWLASADALTGITLMLPPLLLAGFVALRRDSERVNPPQDERQHSLERSVMVTGFIAMFVVGVAGMVWELGSGVAVSELRATAVLLAGCLAAMVSTAVLHRRY